MNIPSLEEVIAQWKQARPSERLFVQRSQTCGCELWTVMRSGQVLGALETIQAINEDRCSSHGPKRGGEVDNATHV